MWAGTSEGRHGEDFVEVKRMELYQHQVMLDTPELAKALEDAIKVNVSTDTYDWTPEAKELIDAGLTKNTNYWFSVCSHPHTM